MAAVEKKRNDGQQKKLKLKTKKIKRNENVSA